MNINLRDPGQYTTLANSESRNGFINRLTVYFDDGDVIISEIPQHDKQWVSLAEFDGRAFSFSLPEVVVPRDMHELANIFLPLVDLANWEKVKNTANDLLSIFVPDDSYVDCYYTSPCTNDEWHDLAARHDNDPVAIEREIRECGLEFIGLTEYIADRLSPD